MNELLYNILSWINSWTGSWGWAMVVFTFLIRLAISPLDYKSRAGMRKTTKLQPQLAALQKKYANDKEKLNAKTAELYKKAGVNPMASCLPMLLTFPILIIVFNAMRTAANREILGQLTQILNGETPKMESWLWIRNIWMPDSPFFSAWPDANTLRMIPADLWKSWFAGLESTPVLMQGLGLTADSFESANLAATIQTLMEAVSRNEAYVAGITPIPGWNNLSVLGLINFSVFQDYNGLLILPILSSVTQIIMTKITGTGQTAQPADANGQSAATGKMMTWFFPIFSLVICVGYTAAFALYWVAGNVISMLQTIVINKMLDKKEQREAALSVEGNVK